MNKAHLARLAIEVRAELGLGDHDRFEPHAWAAEYGVPFVSLSDVAVTTAAVEAFMDGEPSRWSAALVKNGSGHIVIYNDRHAEVRVRSNLAHEIAHIIAEHSLNSNWVDDDKCAGSSKDEEKEAAELGAELLVPVAAARAHAIRRQPASQLADRYGISLELATWRMRASGGEVIAKRAAARRGR